MITILVVQTILILASVIVGYLLHRLKFNYLPPVFAQVDQAAKKAIKPLTNIIPTDKELKVGAIKRPSAQQLYIKNLPEDKKIQQSAIKDSLDNIPELVRAKELIEERRALGLWICAEPILNVRWLS